MYHIPTAKELEEFRKLDLVEICDLPLGITEIRKCKSFSNERVSPSFSYNDYVALCNDGKMICFSCADSQIKQSVNNFEESL